MTAKCKRRWYQFSLRTLFVLVTLFSVACSFYRCYYAEARIEGDIYVRFCLCGMKRARLDDGKIILLEARHDWPADAVVGTTEIKDGICTLRRFDEDGTLGPAEHLQIDHLGAKFYEPGVYGGQIYIILADSWKLYVANAVWRIKNWFRE